jgi:WD40 repeat protein
MTTDGSQFATSCEDGLVHVWMSPSGELLNSCSANLGKLTAVAFCREEKLLAAVTPAGQIILWDVV